jgi:hypothetical protein
LVGCLTVASLGVNSAFAQFPGIPKFPGKAKNNNKDNGRQQKSDGASPAGVPVPPDSPVFDSFRKLEQQSVYHQRMTITANDPQVVQMMAQMGFGNAETITAGDTKQVSMHVKMPALGQMTDFEIRAVTRNGRVAKKWLSPDSGRILAAQDASIAKQLADAEAQYASSISKSLASGPFGMVGAAVDSAAAATAPVLAARASKQAHDFFEWSCMDVPGKASQARAEPPPLTDLRPAGDQAVDGVAATAYEFYVRQNGRSQGPIQMFVAKDTGLPLRIGMNDPRGAGGMQMDYFGFNQGSDFEVPSCISDRK